MTDRAWFDRLMLKYDEPLCKFCFQFQLAPLLKGARPCGVAPPPRPPAGQATRRQSDKMSHIDTVISHIDTVISHIYTVILRSSSISILSYSISILSSCHVVDRMTISYLVTLPIGLRFPQTDLHFTLPPHAAAEIGRCMLTVSKSVLKLERAYGFSA